MEKVFEQIDNLFVNGVINGIISIVIAGIVLIAINKLLNKFIKKKWPDNYVLQKRIIREYVTRGKIKIYKGE